MTRWNISASRELLAMIVALCLMGATLVRAGAEPRPANGKAPADEAAALLARSSVSTFEILPGEWRAGGLANRGYDPASYSDYRANVYAYADKGSGEIWQVIRHD